MIKKIFEKGITLESNTIYEAKENRYDIYLEDCVESKDPVYLSYTNNQLKTFTVGFLLKGLKNVVLDFNNATLVFHGRIAPFVLDGCENVKIINFKIDYDRPFYTQAKVIECSPKQMKIRIDDGFDYRVDNGYLYVTSETWEKNLNRNDCLLWMFDKTGERAYPIILALFGPQIFPNENPPLPIGQILIEEDGENLILKGDFPELWDANGGKNNLIFTHEVRDKCTITFVNCKNLYIENFILIHGAAYALMGMNSENIYIDNFSMYMDYENNGRLVTNNADGVHLFNCKGDFVLKNSYMEGLLDDTVNIHNNYLPIVKIEDNKITCKCVGASLKVQCPIFVKDDVIAVFKGKTQVKKGEYKIVNVTLDDENKQVVFELDSTPSNVDIGDIIENLSANPNVLIENCEFGLFRGTMRLQSRNKTVIRNCQFKNNEVSLLFTGDTTYWYESGPVKDFLVDGCKFYNTSKAPRILYLSEVEFTDDAPFYHENITVQNCYFDKGCAAYISHTNNFTFKNNNSDGEIYIKSHNCGNVTTDCDVKEE